MAKGHRFKSRVIGPDGKEHVINFQESVELENLFKSLGKDVRVFEGKFPWIKSSLGLGYKVFLGEKWKRFRTAVRGGFFVGDTMYLHKDLPVEEKLAIAFHELAHIAEAHPEGTDLETEREATEKAIEIVRENKEKLISKNINWEKVIKILRKRLMVQEKRGI